MNEDKFAIVQIKPPRYAHALTFAPVANLLNESLKSLGFQSDIHTNELFEDKTNIIVGYNLLPPQAIDALAAHSCIIYQLEQLSEEEGWFNATIERALRAAGHIWDYSHENIEFLTKRGIRGVRYLPLGFHPALNVTDPVPDPDIDVLFFGSVNDRRAKIIDQLKSNCRTESLFGIYGRALDRFIGRAKIILNLHYYELRALEKVRISYLLNNGCFVVSEESRDNPYGDGIVAVKYDNLVETCLKYLDLPDERRRIADAGYELLRQMPMEKELARVLAEDGLP